MSFVGTIGGAGQAATAGIGAASDILGQIGGLFGATNWNVQESSYGHPPGTAIKFHTFTVISPTQAVSLGGGPFTGSIDHVQDSFTRRVVPFQFPYKDGQTTEDLGRGGESFEFNILLFGIGYYDQYQALIQEFNRPTPGTLTHPIRGQMTVRPTSVTVIHESEKRQAVAIRVTFVEHNFDLTFTATTPTLTSLLATAVGFISQISQVTSAITATVGVSNQILTSLGAGSASYQANYTAVLTAMNTTFNNGSAQDLPALLPTNSNQSQQAFNVAQSPNDPFSAITSQDVAALASPVLAGQNAQNQVATLMTQLNTQIDAMSAINNGQGALLFYDQIQTLKQSAIAIQSALIAGLKSSQAMIVNYTVPTLMSLREVAFANGLTPDDSVTILQLNPQLLSTNYIPAGTVVQVPVSA